MNEVIDSIINKLDTIINSINVIINEFIYNKYYYIVAIWFIVICLYLKRKWSNEKYKSKKFIIKNELSKQMSVMIALFFLSRVVGTLELNRIIDSFKYILNYCIPDILLFILFTYIINYMLYKNRENLKKLYINIMLYVVQVFFFISCFFGIRFMFMSLAGIINVILIKWTYEVCSNESNNSNNEIKLYKCREAQLTSFNDIVQSYSSDENAAIALCGEWGSGKSEFLKKYISKYSEINNYIYIKPMISDTLDGLINQFSKQLILRMKEQGIYIERNSSIKKYFEEILNLISFNIKVSLNTFMLNKDNNDSSYIELKKLMQKDIDILNKSTKHKIVVIVDDFDRIDEDKQEIILHFIKEILDFKGCTTIFALDYKNLSNGKKLTLEYIEKFVQKNIDLVKPDFCEIIEYHQENILKEDKLKEDFSKKILKEIKDNIYVFHINIQNRVTKKIDEMLQSNKGGTTVKDDKLLDRLYTFCIEKFENRSNSRKIIYFLDNIQDTIELIDKIYPAYNNGKELIESINTAELIYFFNYIKVFEKDIYNDLINKGGVEEYLVYLRDGLTGKNQSEDNWLIEEYFKSMIGNIILPNINNLVFKDEEKELKRKNQLNFIKDVFIDYNFTVNNIQLITRTKQLVNKLNGNTLDIEKDTLVNSLISMLKYINSDKDDNKKISSIEKISKYMIEKYKKSEISFEQLIDLCTNSNYYINIKDVGYYLMPLKTEIEELNISIGNSEYKLLVSAMKFIELENIFQSSTLFELILNIISINDNILTSNLISEITQKIRGITTTKKLIETLKIYLGNNNIIKSNLEDLKTINDIFEEIKKQIKVDTCSKVPLNYIYEDINKFLKNNELIEFFKSSHLLNKEKITDFEEIAYDFNLTTFKDIESLLKEIENNNSINKYMIMCFQQSMKYVNEHLLNEIDEKFKSICEKIFDKIQSGDCIYKAQYIYISILLQKIINHQITS